jgi:hypothetical protein
MNITLPDPYPGRCKNHRWAWNRYYRCLDYEDTKHVCEFDIPESDPAAGSSKSWTQSSQPIPKPWVKPGDQTRSEP